MNIENRRDILERKIGRVDDDRHNSFEKFSATRHFGRVDSTRDEMNQQRKIEAVLAFNLTTSVHP